MDEWFGVDYKDGFELDSCVVVGNGVILPISQTSDERVDLGREELFDLVHEIGFDVACLFEYFLFDGRQELFRLGY